jgi:hypothetical protein
VEWFGVRDTPGHSDALRKLTRHDIYVNLKKISRYSGHSSRSYTRGRLEIGAKFNQELTAVGAHSRRKGANGEREVVALARAAGLESKRTWHLAQSPDAGERCCDLLIAGQPAQVKIAADGFRALYAALEGVELAFVRADRQPWLAVLPAEKLLRLLQPR